MVEALIDFGEGDDIEDGVYEQARQRVSDLRNTIQIHLQDSRRGEIVRSGIRLAIFGPPNAGKSSLLNFLAKREAAIVTSIPGTTRDILELSLDIDGLPIIVSDTAGLRHTDDLVESIGVERARNAVKAADVSLCVLALPEVVTESPSSPINIPPELGPLISPDTFFLLNKSDLLPSLHSQRDMPSTRAWTTSLSTGEGTTKFLSGFGQALKQRYSLADNNTSNSQTPLITHARHRVHLETAYRFLEAFDLWEADDAVLAAEELRHAARAIEKISGLIGTEDILDALFRDFCIGK